MTIINDIENSILGLDGGSFQKLMDAYLYRKYEFDNINPLGSQTASNKTTKGTPDSFVEDENGKYTLIMYGSVKKNPYKKMRDDILSCFDSKKLTLDESKIKRIICAYTSTDITLDQLESLKNIKSNIEIILIGLGTISHDLLLYYPNIAKDFLNINIDTGQIRTLSEFINDYDQNKINPSLTYEIKYRDGELNKIRESIEHNRLTILSGNSGLGKTRLAIEICNRMEQEGYKILCIENNDMDILDDLNRYTSESGKYLMFIDDANLNEHIKSILSFIHNNSNINIDLKLIITVRDYAKSNVESIIKEYMDFNDIVIKGFTEDQVRNIIISNLKITDNEFLNRIVEISKGNIRIAIFSGLSFLNDPSLKNSKENDVFKLYYFPILRNKKITSDEKISLFLISFLPNKDIENNDLGLKILKYFNMTIDDFKNCCKSLYEKELVDIYLNKLVEIEDQSFGDFILKYILIDNKDIGISKLLDYGFPVYKDRIIYVLNTLINVFQNESTMNYIIEQINKSWENASENVQLDYLENFYIFAPEKALDLINDHIDGLDSVSKDLSKVNFSELSNMDTNKYVNILGGFKNSKYLIESIELLAKLLKKRPDLVSEIYYEYVKNMIYGSDSYKDNYLREYVIISNLWKYANDLNSRIFYIEVVKKFLDCKVENIESGILNTRAIRLISFDLVNCTGIEKIRDFIWNTLSQIYASDDVLKSRIKNLLQRNYNFYVDKENYIDISNYDLKCITKYFKDKLNESNLSDAIILYRIIVRANRLNLEYDSWFLKYQQNLDINIFELFSKQTYGVDYDQKELIKKKNIEQTTQKYNIMDFEHLFDVLLKINEIINDSQIESNKYYSKISITS